MQRLFVDTAAWIGLEVINDEHHPAAEAFRRGIRQGVSMGDDQLDSLGGGDLAASARRTCLSRAVW